MFLCLLLQHRISTRDFLVRRRLFNLSQATCHICNINIKIMTHFFLHCYASWRLWQCFMNWFGISWCMPESIVHVILQWSDLVKGRFQRRTLTMQPCGILWNMQNARNKLIFEDIMPVWSKMFELILHRLSLQLKVADVNFSYTGNDLFRSLNGILEWTNK